MMTSLWRVQTERSHEEMQGIYLNIIVVIKLSVKSGEQMEMKHVKANKTKLDQTLGQLQEK